MSINNTPPEPMSVEAARFARRTDAYWHFAESTTWGGSDSEHSCRTCGGRYPIHRTPDCLEIRFEAATARFIGVINTLWEERLAEVQAEIYALRLALQVAAARIERGEMAPHIIARDALAALRTPEVKND